MWADDSILFWSFTDDEKWSECDRANLEAALEEDDILIRFQKLMYGPGYGVDYSSLDKILDRAFYEERIRSVERRCDEIDIDFANSVAAYRDRARW